MAIYIRQGPTTEDVGQVYSHADASHFGLKEAQELRERAYRKWHECDWQVEVCGAEYHVIART